MSATWQRWLVVFSLGLGLDQVTKIWWGRGAVLNSGVALSWLDGAAPFGLTIFLTIFTLGLAILLWPKARLRPQLTIAHTLLLAGATSNLLDRWFLGGVRDIWLLPIGGIRNNLADWLIVGGVLLLLR